MEVEHLLEEDKSGLASDEATKYFDGCVSNEGLPSKTSDFEGISVMSCFSCFYTFLLCTREICLHTSYNKCFLT